MLVWVGAKLARFLAVVRLDSMHDLNLVAGSSDAPSMILKLALPNPARARRPHALNRRSLAEFLHTVRVFHRRQVLTKDFGSFKTGLGVLSV